MDEPMDKRNFVERYESTEEKLTGRVPTRDDMAKAFSKKGLKQRAADLDSIDAELTSDEPLSMENIRRHLRVRGHRRALGQVHEAMRRAKI